MNIIAFLIVGLIAGFLAGKIVEGHGFGTAGDIVVGIVGAFLGGFLFNGRAEDPTSFWGSVLTATIGAIVLLFVGKILGRTSTPPPNKL